MPISYASRAAALTTLLTSTEPHGAQERDALAARHAKRNRGRRPGSRPSKKISLPAARREYVYEGPTKLVVLNAFLHELGVFVANEDRLVEVDDDKLTADLCELGRTYAMSLLGRLLGVEESMNIADTFQEAPGAKVVLFLLRLLGENPGSLGTIARDFRDRSTQARAGDSRDRLARCMMAAFVGQIIVAYKRLEWGKVEGEIGAKLGQLLTKTGMPLHLVPLQKIEAQPEPTRNRVRTSPLAIPARSLRAQPEEQPSDSRERLSGRRLPVRTSTWSSAEPFPRGAPRRIAQRG